MAHDVWETPEINHKTKSIYLSQEEFESCIWLGCLWKRQKAANQIFQVFTDKNYVKSHRNKDKRREIISLA